MSLDRLVLVDRQADIGAALDTLADLADIGVDVERADWDRYYRSAALIQLGGEGRVVVIDPLALDDLAPVQRFLEERRVVLHAMENDLVPLAASGIAPPVVDDTSIAAALLGLPTGLETLLREVLGVELDGDKAAMQRADWEQRPLPEAMVRYAAGDVADLPALWHALAEQLEAAGRMSWYDEELAAALTLPPAEERRDWTRTKGAGRLRADAQGRLRALWEAREHTARETDTAPGRLMGDRLLVEFAERPPRDTKELQRRGMRRQAVRAFGATALQALDAAEPLSESGSRRARASTDEDRELADRLKVIRARMAAELGIPPGVLCPARTLLHAVVSDPADGTEARELLGLRGWQWEILGAPFCEALGIPIDASLIDQSPDDEAQI